MDLILLRHGHDRLAPGGDTILSQQGRKKALHIGQQLVRWGFSRADLAYSSPLTRAVQTLDAIASAVECPNRSTDDRLQPAEASKAIDQQVLAAAADGHHRVLIVGHEPQLSNAFLRWCGFPENEPANLERPPWIFARAEGVFLRPEFTAHRINVTYPLVRFIGQSKAPPQATSARRAGVF